ncbi:MAG: tetratricopeptide repeat protein, partial [Candidatus Krumholzibacteria bacterium]|nr:tetratricopeptide repeat protein [Candidatus Krumholzibacteria bacterium]
RIARGPLKADEAVDIAIHVAQGLQAAHEKGVVHRDIKSANIMLTVSGQVKIMDFGLAKLAGRSMLTRAGTMMGTAAYMSPEQARGEEADLRADIWSTGVVLYEMLAGRLPFAGEYEQAILFQIMNAESEPLTSVRSGVPMELERIVTKCLEKNPAERYQSAAELLADLRHLRRTAEADGSLARPAIPARPGHAARARRWYWTIPAILLVAVAVAFMVQRPAKKAAGPDEKSIAVLPFQNMSDSKDDEYFSDGITEDIITQLSKIADLNVISRQSTMQYKNSGKSLRDIARELHVAAVLEGSVRRAGNQVRIVAQLIDARSDRHIWAETYDKEMTEIFAIQSDVAQKIADALQATLLPAEKAQIEKLPTKDLTAYDYYLKGRQYYYRYTSQSNETAIELFRKALELDPDYALAIAGLADAYAQRVDKYGYWSVWADSAIAISKFAIAKDPKLADGYKALGLAYELKGRLKQSREAYRKALELNPRCAAALGNLGLIDCQTGNFEEACSLAHESIRIDPMIAYYRLTVAYLYLGIKDYAKAKEYCTEAIELQPDLATSYQGLAMVFLSQGDYPGAVEQIEKALTLDPHDYSSLDVAGEIQLHTGDYGEAARHFAAAMAMDSLGRCALTGACPAAGMAYALLKTGQEARARSLADRIIDLDKREIAEGNEWPTVPYEISRMYAMLGRDDEAFSWLKKAIEAGSIYAEFQLQDPFYETLREDARFKQLAAQIKAMLDDQRRRVLALESKER